MMESSSSSEHSSEPEYVEVWQPPLSQGEFFSNDVLPSGIKLKDRFSDLGIRDQMRYRSSLRFGGFRVSRFEERPKR